MNLDDVKELIEIINKNNISELDLEHADFKIRIKKGFTESETLNILPKLMKKITPTSKLDVQVPSEELAAPISKEEKKEILEKLEADGVESEKEQDNLHVVTAPMVGTFYRAPAPDADPFVDKGDKVNEESVLCILEAMKLMNEIKAEVRGVIREILVENGHPVEYGQPLFKIELHT